MSNFSMIHCLIVDNDVYIRRMLREMLQQIGISKVEGADNGAQAISHVESSPCELVLTEIDTPVVSGTELAGQIRKSKKSSINAIPIIGYSNTVTVESATIWRDAGINAIMTKPFYSAVLSGRVNSVLASPRPFVNVPSYAGPCRRRKVTPDWKKPRRQADLLQKTMSENTSAPPSSVPIGAASQAALLNKLKRPPEG